MLVFQNQYWRNFDWPKITYWFFISNCREQISICVYDIKFIRQSILSRFFVVIFSILLLMLQSFSRGCVLLKITPDGCIPHTLSLEISRDVLSDWRARSIWHTENFLCPLLGLPLASHISVSKTASFPQIKKDFQSLLHIFLHVLPWIHWCTCTLPWNLRNQLSMSGRTFLVLCWLYIEIHL